MRSILPWRNPIKIDHIMPEGKKQEADLRAFFNNGCWAKTSAISLTHIEFSGGL